MYCITINLKGTFISCSCTCVSSDDSHCFIANRNQGNTPGKFILTSIRSATVCALLIDIICPSNTERTYIRLSLRVSTRQLSLFSKHFIG